MENERSVKSLISDKLFCIPIYQRSYVWTNQHWKALWQDIIDIAEGKNKKHFIGSVICSTEKENVQESQQKSEYLVIDGQQRLTTFILIVAAVCYYLDHLKKQHKEAEFKLREFKDNYLFEKESDKEQRLRLRPADPNENFFNSILDPLRSEIELPPSFNPQESQIYGAFNFFKDKIEERIRKHGDEVTVEQQIKDVTNLVDSAFKKM